MSDEPRRDRAVKRFVHLDVDTLRDAVHVQTHQVEVAATRAWKEVAKNREAYTAALIRSNKAYQDALEAIHPDPQERTPRAVKEALNSPAVMKAKKAFKKAEEARWNGVIASTSLEVHVAGKKSMALREIAGVLIRELTESAFEVDPALADAIRRVMRDRG